MIDPSAGPSVRGNGPHDSAADDDVSVLLENEPTVRDVVRGAIAASVSRLVTHDAGVRTGNDPEDVHQARVATRRLRSDLRTFSKLLDATWTRETRAELRWLGDALGAVRDREVMLDRVRAGMARLAPDDQEPLRRIVDHLCAEWDGARRALLDAVGSQRYEALVARLVTASRQPPLLRTAVGPDGKAMARAARAPWVRLRNSVKSLPRHPSDAELHEVRIHAKHSRYAAEAFAPYVGKRARRFARRLAALQDVLGEHQDAVVAEQWLREVADGVGGSEAFAAGMLAGFAHDDADRTRTQWPGAWRRARRKKLRAWM